MEVQKADLLFCLFLFSVFLTDYTESTEDCMHCRGDDYRGNISITESGHTCQRWDSDPLNKYTASTYPEKNLEKNFCRNPDGELRPWCYSTNPSKRWEFCSIPRCRTEPAAIVPDHTCITGDGSSYRGTVSVTKSGKTCQSWTSQTPHTHGRTPDNSPCKGLAENYCRNPGNDRAPWCFTTDPETRWEYCNVSRCREKELTHQNDGMMQIFGMMLPHSKKRLSIQSYTALY
ncbi:plasminogen-like [Triplophysa dalaica]|uniref:plasminogen-like n=1 Tax=Triplophysa dalaica TaxID=1582913 RepID=UPI0024DF3F3D|nr:plasminogen-like [Triplophysa dalaica]XP_056620649.1 plasminogen-like [Triplophysa dalaica]